MHNRNKAFQVKALIFLMKLITYLVTHENLKILMKLHKIAKDATVH